jgi:urease accessory protein
MTMARMAFPRPSPTAMAELDRLRLTQILSPAFPIGAFAHSQGLEWAIAEGKIADGDDLRLWIEAVIRHGSGKTDAVFLSMARRAGADLSTLATLYAAYLPAAERAVEAAELGRGFGNLTNPAAPTLPYVLALGRETAPLKVPEAEVLALFLQALAAQLISAAVRFLPLGQAEGQRVLGLLAPAIAETAKACSGAGEEALFSFTPGADIAAMAHETMETRIFRT